MPQLDAAQKQWEADIVAYDVTLPELRPDSQASDAAKQAAQQVMDILKSPNRTPPQQQVVQDYFRGTATQLFAAERDAWRRPSASGGIPRRAAEVPRQRQHAEQTHRAHSAARQLDG